MQSGGFRICDPHNDKVNGHERLTMKTENAPTTVPVDSLVRHPLILEALKTLCLRGGSEVSERPDHWVFHYCLQSGLMKKGRARCGPLGVFTGETCFTITEKGRQLISGR